jgi:pimeloyl-ACP methyl ester carboxylesterase
LRPFDTLGQVADVSRAGDDQGAAVSHVDVGGLRIAYERAGAGPPILFLHGFVGDGRSTWQRQLEDLSDEYTVVAWDAPGAGRSDDPPASFLLPEYADCLAEFVNALGVTRPHVAGLSFGGALALELYRRHPAIPRTLILAGAYAGWAGSLPPDVVAERLEQSLQSSTLPPHQFVETMLGTMFSRTAPHDRVREFATSVADFHPSGFRAMARASAEADLRDVLRHIAVPTLLLYGDEDVRAPTAVGEALHRAIPASKLVVLGGVGHASCVEAADRFTDEVRSFLHATETEPDRPSAA